LPTVVAALTAHVQTRSVVEADPASALQLAQRFGPYAYDAYLMAWAPPHTNHCRSSVRVSANDDAKAKAMLGSKKQLTGYPDRFDPNITMHEPQLLPFEGDYQGIGAFQKVHPPVEAHYEFTTWECHSRFAGASSLTSGSISTFAEERSHG
jgi:hypothetical protein